MANSWIGSGGQNFPEWERGRGRERQRQRNAKKSDTGDFPVGRDVNRSNQRANQSKEAELAKLWVAG